jgi:ATP-dependent Zn protease
MSVNERWAAAVHEAGHAIVAHDLGRVTHWAVVDDAGDGWNERVNEFVGLSVDACQHLIADNVVMLYGGEVAERLAIGRTSGSTDDRRKIDCLVACFRAASPLFRDECRDRAASILRGQTVALDRLARLLAQRGTLAADEILDALRTSWRYCRDTDRTPGTEQTAK